MISKGINKFCCEDISLIENYEKAINDSQMWECHHRLEVSEEGIFSPKELKEKGLYYHRPANELIFLTRKDHDTLHGANRKQETRDRISVASTQRWSDVDYQKKVSEGLSKAHKEGKFDNVFTEEVRQKQSESAKKAWDKYGDKFREIRQSKEYREKLSKGNSGKVRTEDNKKRISDSVKKLHENPEYRKRFEEACKKNAERNKGQKQYTVDGKHRWIKRDEIVPEGALEGWV